METNRTIRTRTGEGPLRTKSKAFAETRYWLDLLLETGYIVRSDHALLHDEVDELLSMLNKSILTNKAKLSAPPPSR